MGRFTLAGLCLMIAYLVLLDSPMNKMAGVEAGTGLRQLMDAAENAQPGRVVVDAVEGDRGGRPPPEDNRCYDLGHHCDSYGGSNIPPCCSPLRCGSYKNKGNENKCITEKEAFSV